MQVSIVISSYNYGRFLQRAIESALSQTYCNTEVIVVDDGSTDESRDIIKRYGDSVVPVLKTNGGQGSSLNAGFATSHGDVVIFLDSDDFLAPKTVETAVELFHDDTVVKVHWPLRVVDETGALTGRIHTPRPSEGDLLNIVLRNGPACYWWPPTSGNAWARRFLEAVLPMPAAIYKTNPDMYLCTLAPLFGRIRKTLEPQGFWRRHGLNASSRVSFDEKINHGARLMDHCIDVFSEYCRRRNIVPSTTEWRARSWWHKLQLAIKDIETIVPMDRTFILVDHGSWGTSQVSGRRCLSFRFYGEQSDTAGAVGEVERLRQAGADFMVFVWPRLWCLNHFPGLEEHLRGTGQCALENDRAVVFELK